MNTLDEATTLEDVSRAEPAMGPRIRIARENAEMSREELAAHLGVLPESVAGWESDQRMPRANRLQMLAGVLGVSIAWLLEGREDERMADAGAPTMSDVQGRLESARALLHEGIAQLESAEEALAELRSAKP